MITARQLADQLADAAIRLDDLKETDEAAGRHIIAAAHPPRRTGAMAAGTTVHATATGAAIFSTARYWTFVHYGAPRHHQRAQPWLREAIPPARDAVVAVYLRHATTATDKIG